MRHTSHRPAPPIPAESEAQTPQAAQDNSCPGEPGNTVVSRRDFLRRTGALVAAVTASPALSSAAEASPNWREIRGFNYQPSFGRNGIEIWLDRFDPAVVEHELALGRKYFPAMNAVRLWLSFDAFLKAPQQFVANFQTVLESCKKWDLKAIPVLFNNWHSLPDFGGISAEMIGYWFASFGQNGESPAYVFRPYLEALFGGHGAEEQILAWDLCNEPFNTGEDAYLPWLNHTYRMAKRLGARQAIGVSVGASIHHLELVDPFSDVLMIHPYFAPNVAWEPLESLAAKCGKPLLATECCWGALDDARRVEIIRADLGVLREHKVGFLAHALHESYVADLHRPQYGVVSGAEYMAFVHMDGSLRAGHEVFNQL